LRQSCPGEAERASAAEIEDGVAACAGDDRKPANEGSQPSLRLQLRNVYDDEV
jgi:hypothetical protein